MLKNQAFTVNIYRKMLFYCTPCRRHVPTHSKKIKSNNHATLLAKLFAKARQTYCLTDLPITPHQQALELILTNSGGGTFKTDGHQFFMAIRRAARAGIFCRSGGLCHRCWQGPMAMNQLVTTLTATGRVTVNFTPDRSGKFSAEIVP